jgi:glucose-6-phosphate 1-dehydrogenase
MAEPREDALHVEIPDHLFVIFGATGDLSRRKLLPALHHVLTTAVEGRGCVLGISRSDLDDVGFRDLVREALAAKGLDPEAMSAWCDQCVHYEPVGAAEAGDYARIRARIEAIESGCGLPGNRVFYLALPPRVFGPTIEALGAAGLAEGPGWTRLVIEKPFGHDLASAQALNGLVHQVFDESQIYRIDHYLGKQTVQNLLVFRFANAMFESLWNRDRIERVEITVAESLGVEGRGGYYDKAGAVRDMIQNHLTQLLTLVAMEVPTTFHADAIRREKIKVLESIHPIEPADVVLGQYVKGEAGGEELPGYREEEGVPPDSRTETFAALKVEVSNWRWQGVPFFLRTGKRMATRSTRIAVRFRCAPVSIFEDVAAMREVTPNVLLITLQPDEGFDLFFEVKAPSEPFHLVTRRLDFRYDEAFGALPDAYETLLLDVVTGDQTLFVHADEVEASWRLYGPVLERIHFGEEPVQRYAAGGWGPGCGSLIDEWTWGRDGDGNGEDLE